MIRRFRRNPLLTATVIVCLALGIGITTVVFSVGDGKQLMLKDLPSGEITIRVVATDSNGDAGSDEVTIYVRPAIF
jgi:hypothetical protein